MGSEELAVIEADAPLAQAPANLFGTDDPGQVVALATQRANALADVIRAKHLYKTIGNKNHVYVEAWCLLGAMLGVFPVVVWTRRTENPEGWEARVEARTLAGAVVGAAEAQCDRTEKTWKGRDEYALRAMAQTRATSRALRGPLGFIVTLAGYEATGAEEMPASGAAKPPKSAKERVNGALHAELGKAEQTSPRGDKRTWEDFSHDEACLKFGVESRADLDEAQLREHLDDMKKAIQAEAVPF